MLRHILNHTAGVIYPATIAYSLMLLADLILDEAGIYVFTLPQGEYLPALRIGGALALYPCILFLMAYLDYQFALHYAMPWLAEMAERRGVWMLDLAIALLASGAFLLAWKGFLPWDWRLVPIGLAAIAAGLVSLARQPRVHVVMPGQSLDDIAAIYGVEREALERENPNKPLEWGEEWRIP